MISDAHTGLKKAISTAFQGAAWQRCRVHFMRNVLTNVPKGSQEMVASIIRTAFTLPTAKEVQEQYSEVIKMLGSSHPKVVAMLQDAREDVLAFAGFPARHWRKIWSTNPMERVNKEIKRRTNVVGVFPNPAALLRLAGITYIRRLLVEAAWQHDRPYARPGARLMKQFQLVDAATRTRAMEGNRRLHHVWEQFNKRGKMRVKANTAVARELAGWCWSVAAPLQEKAAREPNFTEAAMHAA